MNLLQFAAASKGLVTREKIKLILFAAGVKKNIYLILKINQDSLEEKYQFEKILKENDIIYHVSRAKSYEEIKEIKGNKIIWQLAGTWVSYDLFKDRNSEKKFKYYIDLLGRSKHDKADKAAAELYNYPKCCAKEFVNEHYYHYLSGKYSYYEYYKKIYDAERKFPWVFHRAHTINCKETTKLNKIYERTIKENNEKLWEEYSRKKIYKTDLIVLGISDILSDGKSIWPSKDGHEYELITKKPFEGKYYLISYLTKKMHALGQVLEGEVIFRYNHADVTVKKIRKGLIDGLHHERKLPLIGRNF